MDPDAALATLREQAKQAEWLHSREEVMAALGDMAEQFEALDQWLTKGGFLPEAWKPKPVTHPCPRCGKDVFWDTEHLPSAWRHVENDSRWCTLTDEEHAAGKGPQIAPGTGNPDRYRTEDPDPEV